MARVSLCPVEANASKGGIVVYSVIQDLAQSSAQASGSGPAWEMAGVIAAAGAFGGLVNALLNSGNGFSIQLPRRGTNDVLQLGTVGNLVLGIAAALISWGLYGPLRDAALVQAGPAGLPAGSQTLTATSTASLTITAVIGAILAGAGGARVISNELDKKLLRDAGAGAAQQPANPQLAVDIATLAPAKALRAAKNTGGSPTSPDEPSGAASPQPVGASVTG